MMTTTGKAFSFKALLLYISRILLRRLRNPRSLWRKGSNAQLFGQPRFQKFHSFAHRSEISDQTLIFDVEGALLRPSSLFPYFMLVAFEAGSLLRSLVLLLLYPFVCMASEEMGLKIMVFVCFFGIKKESFRVGAAVLPKFFLEDVGVEGFETLRKFRRNVGVSALPKVMVEGFLRDYLGVESVVGRELKVFRGYFVGLMEDKEKTRHVLQKVFGEDTLSSRDIVGIGGFNKSLDHQVFSYCKEIYLVSEAEKRNWSQLQRENYLKPLIFHDGRLAFRPTPLATLFVFMWIPLGFTIAIIRAIVALLLPYKISTPILVFTGMRLKQTIPKSSPSMSRTNKDRAKGILYVCNHRTLLDPLYLSTVINKPLTAVTYSLSRVSEILAPIKTVRLTRDREQDAEMMEKLLSQGDLVVCPEGTTCREPYLLRFSPLFAEMSNNIVPVAMDTHVSMFYGTTAGGLKCLDPLFFLMNPFPAYKVRLLEEIRGSSKLHDSAQSRFDVANNVQEEIGRVLGFECTTLTRKDKYLILAGNEGIVRTDNKPQNQRGTCNN
ncbi:PREDICTED: probable glycerol-3-phosphate acyltransferase 3 [Nelumbo nucifera]|uniref:Phospholipid/glycerol acyltransferase domain-containing protein n=2 Tax=Nelumbo nucifera TaxID=4432 RepID=A0A822YKE3_NELNU|nr:PREDICTED: probable glycerol-3-phosphate acyltransferase 3 [Nelumbo nucifera]DAD33070.1 TPA_asm: hypothetical protein HUJ06_011921 [Nelumbo nucifera]